MSVPMHQFEADNNVPSLDELRQRGEAAIEQLRMTINELHIVAALNGREHMTQSEDKSGAHWWKPGWRLIQ